MLSSDAATITAVATGGEHQQHNFWLLLRYSRSREKVERNSFSRKIALLLFRTNNNTDALKTNCKIEHTSGSFWSELKIREREKKTHTIRFIVETHFPFSFYLIFVAVLFELNVKSVFVLIVSLETCNFCAIRCNFLQNGHTTACSLFTVVTFCWPFYAHSQLYLYISAKNQMRIPIILNISLFRQLFHIDVGK